MKKCLVYILLLALFLTGCKPVPIENEDGGVQILNSATPGSSDALSQPTFPEKLNATVKYFDSEIKIDADVTSLQREKFYSYKVNEAFSLNLTEINIKIISYTSAGRVSTLKLGEKSVKATALRKALGLRSTDFTFEKTKDGITFFTKGYGHGVGLSQFGANELAKDGKTYHEILTHYYSGTTIRKL